MHYDVNSGRVDAKHRIKTVLLSTVVLLFIFTALGVGYTWYNGRQPLPQTPQAATPGAQLQQIKPKLPSRNSQESAAVEVLTSPVAPGENSMMTVKTNAGSTCKIAVVYNNVPEVDSGLAPKKADDFGTVSWAWTVPKNTPLGSWPVTVTCQFYDKSAVVSQDVRVEKSTSSASSN